jgi:uncharacterized protein YegL
MTEVGKAQMPAIPPLESSPTNLGEALELMCQLTEKDVKKTNPKEKGDWLPMAVVMTDGSPSDTQLFETMVKALKDGRYRFSRIIGCAAGPKAKSEKLKMFATDVVILDEMDSNSFEKFFGWVSQSVGKHSQSTDLSLDQLPDPPKEIRIEI